MKSLITHQWCSANHKAIRASLSAASCTSCNLGAGAWTMDAKPAVALHTMAVLASTSAACQLSLLLRHHQRVVQGRRCSAAFAPGRVQMPMPTATQHFCQAALSWNAAWRVCSAIPSGLVRTSWGLQRGGSTRQQRQCSLATPRLRTRPSICSILSAFAVRAATGRACALLPLPRLRPGAPMKNGGLSVPPTLVY